MVACPGRWKSLAACCLTGLLGLPLAANKVSGPAPNFQWAQIDDLDPTDALGLGADLQGIAVDGHGLVYLADTDQDRVVVFDPAGVAPPRHVDLPGRPLAMAVDPAGRNVYIAAEDLNVILKAQRTGGSFPLTILAQDPRVWTRPYGLALDIEGTLRFTCRLTAGVWALMALPIAGGVPSEVVALGQELQGVAADIYGNVYLASPGADQVLELAGGRLPQDQIGSGLAIPRGVAVDLLGNVFVLGSVPAYQVIKGLGERSPGPDGVPGVTEIQTRCATFPAAQVGGPGTRLTLTFGFKGSGALGGAQVQGPCFVDTGEGTLAQNGPAYDYGYPNSDTATVVVEFDPLRPGAPSGGPGTQLGGLDLMGSDGTIQASVLLDGTGLAPRASFLPATPTAINLGSFGVTPQPMGVAADSLGNVYVADAALGKVVKITPGSHTQPEVVLDGLTSPQGIAVDGDFKVYCADPGSRRVLMGAYRPGNTYLQIIVDSAAENPGLGVPVDVKVDLAGNILVADRSGAQVMTGLRPGDLPQDRQLHQSGVRPGDLPVLPVLHVAVLLGPDPGQLPGVQQAFRPGSAGRPVA